MALALFFIQKGWLAPKPLHPSQQADQGIHWRSLGHSFLPYLLLMSFLLAGKLVFDGNLVRLNLAGGLSHSMSFFNPGLAFLATVLLLAAFRRRVRIDLRQLARSTTSSVFRACLTIFFISSMTYMMIVSGMIEDLADATVTRIFPAYSASIGAFGSFLAGSATVSNLLFGALQVNAAESLNLAVSWMLALQVVGAGAGNMIALPNLLAVQAAVGVEDQERVLIARLIGPCLVYLSVLAGLGLLVTGV